MVQEIYGGFEGKAKKKKAFLSFTLWHSLSATAT